MSSLNPPFLTRLCPEMSASSTRAVPVWLFTCCGMIFIMALIGAITRLTESGLSITDWNPIIGAIPPLSEAEWQRAFDSYQAIPQFQILHRDMDLQAFKGIFFWEYFHRLWGRLIGLVFIVPFVFFAVRKKITQATGLKFAAIFALGAVQGFIGWFMVQSGLTVRTSVSPYRLALHLVFALAIYALLFWAALDEIPATPSIIPRRLLRHGWVALAFFAVTLTWGAFVAGLHAGEVFNTWPLMEGGLLPDGATTLQPIWLNIFENTAMVQFIHRWLAPTTLIVILAWVARCWKHQHRTGLALLAAMGCAQVALGIATLLSHAEIVIAVVHQAGAMTLLSLILFNLNRLSQKTITDK